MAATLEVDPCRLELFMGGEVLVLATLASATHPKRKGNITPFFDRVNARPVLMRVVRPVGPPKSGLYDVLVADLEPYKDPVAMDCIIALETALGELRPAFDHSDRVLRLEFLDRDLVSLSELPPKGPFMFDPLDCGPSEDMLVASLYVGNYDVISARVFPCAAMSWTAEDMATMAASIAARRFADMVVAARTAWESNPNPAKLWLDGDIYWGVGFEPPAMSLSFTDSSFGAAAAAVPDQSSLPR